jgi:hypothetical protein
MGSKVREIIIGDNDVHGQATFIMEGAAKKQTEDAAGRIRMQVVDGAKEITALLADLRASQVDILHINCEGCEWELLLHLAQLSMFHLFAILQVSFHNYGERGIGGLLPKYCIIREALLQTHIPIVVMPFAWERWVRKDIIAS